MKKKLFLPLISLIFLLFICSSCQKKGSCTVRCVCDYGGYHSTTTMTISEELTQDECDETADYYEDSGCSCSGEID